MVDILVIGAGTAGLTAVIYGARAGLSVEVIEKTMFGGQIISTRSVENYPGMPGVSGADFAMALFSQAQSFGGEVTYGNIEKIDLNRPIKIIQVGNEVKEAKTVIIANGAVPKKLGCPGEELLIGAGVSFCATCDGAFHKGKDVAVVGGGNTALEDALLLSYLCRKVYLVHRRDTFRGEAKTLELLRKRENVECLTHYAVEEIHGNNKVEGITVHNTKDSSKKTLEVSGVFVAIGTTPDNAMFNDVLDLDQNGYIVAEESCKTKLPGVFVAGDTRTKPVRQMVTAAADGAVAALAASDYITNG